MKTKSLGKSSYFITFIDDYSRSCWVYFLKTKDEFFDTFKRFKSLVENERGCKIKCLRTDRGGEFCSKYFQNYCDMNGNKRQLTTAYTPQENGVEKRNNYTMVEMERSMLQNKGLRNSFWGDAIATSLYIFNRSPTSALDMMTPYEAWYEKNPNVNHFRVFGYVAYVHVVDQKRQKLDPKSDSFIFVGYSEQIKAYRLYNPLTNSILV
jgi:transposase InsO family protein